MISGMHTILRIGLVALFAGLVLGVAIGRSGSPFGATTLSSFQEPTTEERATTEAVPAITVPQLKSMIEGGMPLALVDVREPADYAQGHLPGSKSIPLSALQSRQDEIPRDRLVVVYCMGDAQSKEAVRELGELGLTNITALAGGMSAWRRAGMTIVR